MPIGTPFHLCTSALCGATIREPDPDTWWPALWRDGRAGMKWCMNQWNFEEELTYDVNRVHELRCSADAPQIT